jgi:adenylylsulfate kinase-like enzyme
MNHAYVQITGLSGAGKTTQANGVKNALIERGYDVEVVGGDEYRQHLCRSLGFSRLTARKISVDRAWWRMCLPNIVSLPLLPP